MIEALQRIPLFAVALQPGDEDPFCVAAVSQGELVEFDDGEQVAQEGTPAAFYVILSGMVRVSKRVDGSDMELVTWPQGTFFGELPLLQGTPFVASGYAVGATKLFYMPPPAFWKLLKGCASARQAIIETMAERMRNLEMIAQGQAQLQSLGTMAAGLAHELNNPAAATRRAAAHLRTVVENTHDLILTLGERTPEALCAVLLHEIDAEVQERVRQARGAPPLDALTVSDREDDLATWLEAHSVANGWQLATTFTQSGLDVAWLETVTGRVAAPALSDIFHWLEAHLTTEDLLVDIEHGVHRLENLLATVRAYGNRDDDMREAIDVAASLDNVLDLLTDNIRTHNVDVRRVYAPDLSMICGYTSELMQVWTNLLDNALDAVASLAEGPRQITIRTQAEGHRVCVAISDNGPGIPANLHERIWDPFFTTKGVGQGTGLGLATSYHVVVQRHHGEIMLSSQPGQTCFEVHLPVALTRTAPLESEAYGG